VLDLKLLLFAGLLVLAARNRYRLLPSLTGPAGRLDALRRSVAGEVALVACVLLAAALLTQLPPGRFALATPATRTSPPANVQVQGSDYTTSVRLALTTTPGTPGPNTFTAKVTDYDTGQPYPAQRVELRFSLRDRPEVSGATLDLAHEDDGSWQAKGSQLSIDGRWVITALVQGPSTALTVPLELRTRTATPRVTVSRAPGQPDLYTIGLPTGGSVQAYLDPGRPGPNTVHFTFFTATGSEQPIDEAHARMTTPPGKPQTIELQVLSAGHFAANVNLQPGAATFTIKATPDRGAPISAGFSQQINRGCTPCTDNPSPLPGRPDPRRGRAAAGRLLGVGRRRRRLGRPRHHRPGTPPDLHCQAHHPQPHNGQTVHSLTPEVRLGLAGAKIVALTSTRIRPDQGHVHLLVDGKLVAMNYGLDERLPKLTPGQHLVQVEFVAADHAPFDPRVLAQAAFIVTP
jgi:hypothetical protein